VFDASSQIGESACRQLGRRCHMKPEARDRLAAHTRGVTGAAPVLVRTHLWGRARSRDRFGVRCGAIIDQKSSRLTDHKVGRIRQRPARGHTVVSICTAPARIETSVLLSRSVATALTRNGSSGADYIASKGAWLRGDERRLSHSRRLCRVILCSRVHRSGEPSDVLGRRRLTRQKGPNSSLRERNMK
jgi:hypothetical protein